MIKTTMTEEQTKVFGIMTAEMLNLKQKKGLYHTTWGTKTAYGLGASILRLQDDIVKQGETK
jgi:hypothetical protein